MTRRRWLAVALAAAALLLVGRAAAGLYADYLWYSALNALPVWRTAFAATFVMRSLAVVAWSAFLVANLYAVRRSVVSIRIPRRLGDLDFPEEVPGRMLDAAAVLLSILLGIALSFAHDDWTLMLLARFGVPFGEIDPYLELDLGYFVYWLPFEVALRDTALVAILVAGALVVFLYALTPSLSREQGTLYVSNYVRRHLFVLLAGLLLILAWSYRIDAYQVLIDGSSAGGAFGFADHHAHVPVSVGVSILAVAAAGLVLWAGWTGQLRIAFIAVGALLILAMSLRQVMPFFVRRSSAVEGPVRERPYVATRAAYTRRAYAADAIRRADSTLMIATPLAAASAVPVWDPPALARALGRSGDKPGSHSVGWEIGPSGLLAIVPATPPTAEEGDDRMWSIGRVSATAVEPRGEPLRVVPGDAALLDDVALPAPLVVDSAAPHVVVPDTAGGVAAPALTTFSSRFAHAWSLQDYGLLAGELPQPNARIVTWRDVRERVRRLAPFFAQGTAVTPVLDGDTLYWVLDLYSTSHSYPLSQPLRVGGALTRYARHAATAVTNAQSGRVAVVASTAPDPITATWLRLLPQAFVPWTSLPARVADLIPPATDGAWAQAAALANAGTRQTGARGGRLPRTDGADGPLSFSTPALFATGSRAGVLAWSVPVLDEQERVTGVVLATGGRGRITAWLPAASPQPRWTEIIDQLRRAADTAGAPSREPRLMRGPIRVIPIGGGIAFVQTAYAVRPDGSLAVARVAAIAPDGAVRTGGSVAAALGVAATPLSPQPAPLTGAAFEARVRALYAEMQRALVRGDWAAFGAAYAALGDLLPERSP
ncbi:MAG: UPF0182 family protein [Gemmatimonadota bacterium]|nr:UPF0182 family protein [Gemmatimonadota bacterium]